MYPISNLISSSLMFILIIIFLFIVLRVLFRHDEEVQKFNAIMDAIIHLKNLFLVIIVLIIFFGYNGVSINSIRIFIAHNITSFFKINESENLVTSITNESVWEKQNKDNLHNNQIASLSVNEIKNINIFFSNFTEAEFFDYKYEKSYQDELIHFGIKHNILNKNITSKKFEHSGTSLLIDKKYIEKTVDRYFVHKSIDYEKTNFYLIDKNKYQVSYEEYNDLMINSVVNIFYYEKCKNRVFKGIGYNFEIYPTNSVAQSRYTDIGENCIRKLGEITVLFIEDNGVYKAQEIKYKKY